MVKVGPTEKLTIETGEVTNSPICTAIAFPVPAFITRITKVTGI